MRRGEVKTHGPDHTHYFDCAMFSFFLLFVGFVYFGLSQFLVSFYTNHTPPKGTPETLNNSS